MSIIPNSSVKVLRGVPLDKNYDDTYYFNPNTPITSKANQISFFLTFVKATYSPMSYLRSGANKIKLNDKADNVRDCNYMMFTNADATSGSTAYDTRTYYAFIDKVNYVSEGCCEIEYTIDVIQSHMFDVVFEPSMIEREHSETDVTGANTIDEGIMFGDFVVTNKDTRFLYKANGSTPLFRCVICYVPNKAVLRKTSAPTRDTTLPYKWNYVVDNYAPAPTDDPMILQKGLLVNGVYMGCTYYTLDFDVRTTQSYSDSTFTFTYADDTRHKLTCAIDTLIEYQANIVSILLVPRQVWVDETGSGYSEDAYFYESEIFKYKNGSETVPATESTYTPKNKKMYCYPYKRIVVSNNAGQTQELKWELCKTNSGNTKVFYFKVNGAILPNAEIMLYPKNYRCLDDDYENGLVLTDFPECSWSVDSFREWWSTNKGTFSMSLISTAITGALSVANIGANGANAIAQSKHPEMTSAVAGMRFVSSGVNAVDNLVKAQFPMITAKATPDQLYGQTSASALRVKMDRIGFTIYELSVDAESAEAIDNYFTMFGYSTKKTKLPNVFNANATLRPYWNFVKTNGANIHPKLKGTTTPNYTGIASDELAQMVAIFDHGIRFWNPSIDIGDYNHDNSPT